MTGHCRRRRRRRLALFNSIMAIDDDAGGVAPLGGHLVGQPVRTPQLAQHLQPGWSVSTRAHTHQLETTTPLLYEACKAASRTHIL